VIALEAADVYYGRALALKHITVRVAKAEVVAIVGRNGAGKTTVLKSLCGLLPLGAGRRRIGEQDATDWPVERVSRAGVALVPDSRRIFSSLTVLENLRMGALAHRPGKWNIDAVLDAFPKLKERLGFYGDQLSGGEQQMLAIGRALLSNPSFLLLDEPTEGLAPRVVDELIGVLTQVHAAGTSLVVVEQNMKLPMRLATRQYVLDHGVVAWQGSREDMHDQREHVESLLATGT
jgi:branched-chain amino acid transport system ATP-binding protein